MANPAHLAYQAGRSSRRLQDGVVYEREDVQFEIDAIGNVVDETRRTTWTDSDGAARSETLRIRTDFARHALHGEACVWVEKNCYADVWIELLHTLKLEPLALMPFTLAADFEGDHWTFFKPPLPDLQKLYGIDVQELNVWRPLIEHAAEHLAAGKFISTEADAFWRGYLERTRQANNVGVLLRNPG